MVGSEPWALRTDPLKMDVLLIFDVLMYINMYYYPMSIVCNSIMTLAKYQSIIDTPEIGRDASVQGALLSCELIKLVLFKKLRAKREGMSTYIFLFLTRVKLKDARLGL